MEMQDQVKEGQVTTDTCSRSLCGFGRRRLGSLWFGVGLVLWAFALVAAIVMLRRRPVAESDTNALLPAMSHNASGQTADEPKKPLVAPPSAWDPKGVQDFKFTERSGRTVTKADLLGQPWLISFIFTRCAGPCPRVSIQMSELQKLLQGSDVRLISMTVDPAFDTTAVLSRYAESFHADRNRWLYLTGDKQQTYKLINESFRMPVLEMTGKNREPGYEVMHSTNILLVNEKGVVVHKYNALDEVDMLRLRKDLKPYLSPKNGPSPAERGQLTPIDSKGPPH